MLSEMILNIYRLLTIGFMTGAIYGVFYLSRKDFRSLLAYLNNLTVLLRRKLTQSQNDTFLSSWDFVSNDGNMWQEARQASKNRELAYKKNLLKAQEVLRTKVFQNTNTAEDELVAAFAQWFKNELKGKKDQPDSK